MESAASTAAESTTATEPAASTPEAGVADARESVIALHARLATVLDSAKSAMTTATVGRETAALATASLTRGSLACGASVASKGGRASAA
jgi:hypothetical protein